MNIIVRKSNDRAFFDYGWLKTFHTFSFGQYQDLTQMGFRCLRVINEDRLLPGVGFPMHPHRDMEIFTLVVEGGLAHQDDLGNSTILRPGKVQLISAGQGITHCELNASDKEEVHFFQVWIVPNVRKLKPRYQEKWFQESAQENKWNLILSHDGEDGSLPIHQDVKIYLATLDPDMELNYNLDEKRFGWLQMISGNLTVNGIEIETGDGMSISQMKDISLKAREKTKLIFFDLN